VPDDLSFSNVSEYPAHTRLTPEEISSLEDMRGEPLPTEGSSRPTERPLPPKPEETVPGKEQPRAVSAAESPLFYRPASPGTKAGTGPVCGDLRGTPAGGRIVFPLERRFFYSYEDTWGAPRAQGGHEGTDLMTPSGVPEYAITDGTVVPVAGSDADGWNFLGGNAVMVRADYSIGPVKAGDLFYYAHLEEKSPLEIGDRVSAGQVVGYAGDTGQGPPGTSGLFPPHLHLGWYDGTGGRQNAGSGAMNPYPLLEWIRSNGGAVSGSSDARFCEAPRIGPPTPSAGNDWPARSDPGLTPDLDTDSADPSPVRAAPANREETSATNRPARPGNPRKKQTEAPDTNRPNPQRPERPQKSPPKPTGLNGDEQNPPKPSPPDDDSSEPDPAPGPPPHQYDPSTGESADALAPKLQREPETARKPAADDSEEPPPKK
jgi:collagen type III alpha